VGNSHDALEVTQDAFLKAFAGLAKLNRPEAFGGWLMRIVSNLSLNYRRGRKARSGLGLDELIEKTGESMPPNADPARQVQSREMGERLESALERLPEKQRTALMMFTIDQLPQKQIAEILGCTVEAVKWHVFQGRKRLRELMKGAI
jgi:RNA polymerase sigma-70 factor (ECF subfamily)